MGRKVGLVFDDRYLAHNTGLSLMDEKYLFPFADPIPHWSGPGLVGRAKHILDLFGVSDELTRIDAYEADDDALTVFHTKPYIDRVAEISKSGGDAGEGAPIGQGGDRIARLAAGGAMAAVDAVMTGTVSAAHALVRPPGHHAMPDKGMGFCIYNNAVIAARHAQRKHGAKKILVLDWDVHHGNGTQHAFYSDPGVLFISLHQDDLYPVGWGAVDQTGDGEGEGFTVNIPLPAGTGFAGYREAFSRLVVPISKQFAPDLIIISAGQDASALDPLARMSLTTNAYREFTRLMLEVAEETAKGRMVATQEGGYAATYAPYCTASIVETLIGDGRAVPEPYGQRADSMPETRVMGLDAARAIDQTAKVQRRFWSV